MADYDAFISYSHAADGGLAPALKGALERLGKPWRRRRALRVFQDASGLGASPGLWSDIQHALDSTRYFVLLASPPAAQSQWVQQEVAYFLSRHPPERCLIAITAGDWSWDGAARDFDWSRSDALPHELHGAFSEEPLVVDLRWARDDRQLELANARFRAAAAELAAPIHGLSPDDLDARDLHEFRKARRIRRLATAGLASLLVVACVAGLLAWVNAREARAQQRQAETNAAEASRNADEASRNAKESDAQRLAAVSVGYDQKRTDLAVLLALHSLERSPTQEGQIALARAMTQPAASSAVLPGSEAGAQGLATDPTGDLLAWGASNGEVVLWDAADEQELRRLAGHASAVRGVAVSSDATLIASVDVDGVLLVHRVRDGRVVTRGQAAGGFELAFRPDDHLFAVGGNDGSVALWDPASGAVVSQIPMGDTVRAVAFSPDGSTLAVGDRSGTVTLLDPDTGATVRSWPIHGSSSPTASAPSTTVPPAPTTDALRPVRPTGAATTSDAPPTTGAPSGGSGWTEDTVSSIAFDPSGRLLATADLSGRIFVWDVETGSELWDLRGHQADALSVAFAPNGETLASSAIDATVRLWDVGSGRLVGDLRGHDWGVPDVVFSAARDSVFSAAADGVRRWDLRTGKPETTFHSRVGVVRSVNLSPDGQHLASAGSTGARLWRTEGGDRPDAQLPGVAVVAFSPTGSFLAGATIDRVKIYDAASGAPVRPLEATGTGLIWNLDVSPDGRSVAAATESGKLVVWDVATGRRSFEVDAHRGGAYAVKFNPDGSALASSGMDGRVRFWTNDLSEMLGETKIVNSDRSASEATPIAFSPDGKLLAAGARDGVLRILDGHTYKELRQVAAHQNRIYDVAFSPVGGLIATAGFNGGGTSNAGFDSGLRLWDADTGQQVGQLAFHDRQVESVAFSADGRWLASGGALGEVALWPGPASWRANACSIAGHDLTGDERARFLQPDDAQTTVCRS